MSFKSRAGQIEHSVANVLPPLQYIFKKSCIARWYNDAEMSFTNSLHAWRNATSVMKDFIYFYFSTVICKDLIVALSNNNDIIIVSPTSHKILCNKSSEQIA